MEKWWEGKSENDDVAEKERDPRRKDNKSTSESQ